jgi:stringent starvation protein B
MPEREKVSRIQAVVSAIIEHCVATSLAEVEVALDRWRAGELGPLDAHGALLKHAARCERVIERVTAAASSRPAGVLRDALDAGLIERTEFQTLTGEEPEDVEPAHSAAEHESATPPDKRSFVEELLERGAVLIHVDARRGDVAVPARFRGDPKLVLRFGYGLTPAIVDLIVDGVGVSGTLTFSGVPFHCVLPWSAVYAAVVEGEQRGMVWPEDIPDVILEAPPRREEERAATPVPPPADVSRAPRQRGHLKLVD